MSPSTPTSRITPIVRRATESDLDAVLDLRAVMFDSMGLDISGSQWRANGRAWLQHRLSDPGCGIFVVEVDGLVVASAMGQVREAMPSPSVPEGRDILINNVCTLPAWRGQGYGRRAFEAVLDWARGTGVHRVELMATSEGRPMYLEAGFHDTSGPCMRAMI